MRTSAFIIACGLLTGLSACSASHTASVIEKPVTITIAPESSDANVSSIPRATVYRTSCDCTDLVPVTLNTTATAIVSYPAPTDLTQNSEPIKLSGGWLLDRRGIGENTRFTNFTYSEYRELTQPPSPTDLMKNLNSECVITTIVRLPIPAWEAAVNPEICEKYLSDSVIRSEVRKETDK